MQQQQERRLAREHPQFFEEDFRRYSDGMVKTPYRGGRKVDVGEIFKKGLIEKVQHPPEIGPKKTYFCGYEFNTKQIWVLSGLSILFILSFAGACIIWFTDVFDKAILSTLILTNNSNAFLIWSKPPVHPKVKVHIFNYTNVDDFFGGTAKKLKVQDVGPYVYQENIERVNIKFNDDGTISYQEHRDYKFLPELSKGRQSDKLRVPNLPLLGAAAMSKYSFFLTRFSMSTLFTSLNAQPFINLPAHRFMWGYDDNLYELAKGVLALRNESPLDKFGIMANKVGTSKDVITINSGVKDINQLGLVRKFNNQDKLHHWSTEDCNTITGSDGSIFPPKTIRARKPVSIYQKDMCRRLPMVFQKEIRLLNDKIPAYRYVLPFNVFDRPEIDPENQCYCNLDSGECPPQGVFNSTPCAMGAPAFISFPHFYRGDPKLLEDIEGLKPDAAEEYETYVDVHPEFGFGMGGRIRLQVNMQVMKSFGISQLDKFEKDVMLPIAWMELSVEDSDLPEEMVELIYQATFTVRGIQLALQYGCILTMFITLLPILLVLKSKWQARRARSRQI